MSLTVRPQILSGSISLLLALYLSFLLLLSHAQQLRTKCRFGLIGSPKHTSLSLSWHVVYEFIDSISRFPFLMNGFKIELILLLENLPWPLFSKEG